MDQLMAKTQKVQPSRFTQVLKSEMWCEYLSAVCYSLSHRSSVYHLMKDYYQEKKRERTEGVRASRYRESNHRYYHHYYNLMLFQMWPLLDIILFSFLSPSCFSILPPFSPFLTSLSLLLRLLFHSFHPHVRSPRFHFRCPRSSSSDDAGVFCNLKTTVSFSQQIHPTHHHSHIVSLHPAVTGLLIIYPLRFTVIPRFSDLGRWSRQCLIDDGDNREARRYPCLSWRLWELEDVKNVFNHRK